MVCHYIIHHYISRTKKWFQRLQRPAAGDPPARGLQVARLRHKLAQETERADRAFRELRRSASPGWEPRRDPFLCAFLVPGCSKSVKKTLKCYIDTMLFQKVSY